MVQISAMRPHGAKPKTGYSAPRLKKVRRPDLTEMCKHLLWIALILAISAYGAVCVQNITEMLMDITQQHASLTAIDRPMR